MPEFQSKTAALPGIKELIKKPGSASKMMALSNIFEEFLKKNPYAERMLPKDMFKVIKEYSDTDIFKYAYSEAEKYLTDFLSNFISKYDVSQLPKTLQDHVNSILEEMTKPGSPIEKIIEKNKLTKEKITKPGEGSPKKKPAQIMPGSVESLQKFLSGNYYKDLYRALPPQVKSKLNKVGLDPDSMFSNIKAMRVAHRFIKEFI